MASSLKAWISASRPRTLPLSVSGILVGSAYAIYQGVFETPIFIFALITTILFQILSNFANDYGDGIKGTDNDERLGPMRALQSGQISAQAFKNGLILTSILSLSSAIILIYLAFGQENLIMSLVFLVLGIIAIIAAIKYTVGDSAYGYRGFGDVFVFIFFGLVSVCGSYVLYAKTLDWILILPGASIGFLSSAVLNLNNMRDLNSDKAVQKNTLAVKLGLQNAKIYHFSLIILGLVSFVLFLSLEKLSIYSFISLISFVILFLHLKFVKKNQYPKAFDPELKKVALSTFAIALIFFVVQILVI